MIAFFSIGFALDDMPIPSATFLAFLFLGPSGCITLYAMVHAMLISTRRKLDWKANHGQGEGWTTVLYIPYTPNME